MDNIYNEGCIYNKTSANLDADFIIGALFPIQDLDLNNQKYIYTFEEMPYVEAFLYTIEKINNSTSILPNVTLGFDVRNSCNNINIAVAHTTDFMLDQKYVKDEQDNILSNNNTCYCRANRRSSLAAVIGIYNYKNMYSNNYKSIFKDLFT